MPDEPCDESELTSKTPGCNRFVRYDVDGLIARFGADWRVPKVLPARCDGCSQPLVFELAALHGEEPET
jgi:hypothetical protein